VHLSHSVRLKQQSAQNCSVSAVEEKLSGCLVLPTENSKQLDIRSKRNKNGKQIRINFGL